MNHEVKILKKEKLNHNVIQFQLERPDNYSFTAGQAIELLLEWPEKKGPAPFTFTGLNTSEYLELTIKIYADHNGLTAALSKLNPGHTVIITDPWDSYINKGPGIFIAGGAGITPFIALLRQLHTDGNIGDSLLFFSNKTVNDIFLHSTLKGLLGERYIDVITRDKNGTSPGQIDEALLRDKIKNFRQPFYVCGPPGFMETIPAILRKTGAEEEMVNVSL